MQHDSSHVAYHTSFSFLLFKSLFIQMIKNVWLHSIALAWCVLNVNISVQKATNILQNYNVKQKKEITNNKENPEICMKLEWGSL